MSSKGITPVIATVLLITITVAATASAFTFMTQIQDDFKESSEDRLNQQQKESKSDFNIEFVYNSSDGYIMMSVRNTGSMTMEVEDDNNKVWNLFADGKPTTWKYQDSAKQSADSVSIDPQQSITLNTTVKFPSEGSDKLLKLSGPHKTADSHVCFNSGRSSC